MTCRFNPSVRLSACALIAFLLAARRAAPASGQVLATPSGVAAILGSTDQIETFTKFHVVGVADALDPAVIDSSTVDFGQGPGLVNPGIAFAVSNFNTSDMQWDLFGEGNSEEFGFNLFQSGAGKVTFAQPTPAFGINLVGVNSVNTIADAVTTVNIFSPNSTLLATEPVTLDGLTPVFFGYEAPGGIGSVTLTVQNYGTGGILRTNYLEYGSAVPEPSSLALIATSAAALLARRRCGRQSPGA